MAYPVFYPVNLRIQNRLCVVIGGGGVAFRKVHGLLAAGARVRVISPTVVDELQKLAHLGDIEWLEREYKEGDLKTVFLVFAATNNRQTQLLIQRDCLRHSLLLNSVDDPDGSDFHIPAHFRRGRMLVTVSTGGGSPALAKRIRESFENDIGPEYETVVDFLALLREKLFEQHDDGQMHAELFHRLLDQGLIKYLSESDWFEVQMLLLRELPVSVDAVALLRQYLERHDR
jgi:precorrin-2 dehydrogenase / sirohydrochlorin ferrochelatase